MWVRAVSVSGEASLWSTVRVFTVAQTNIDAQQDSRGKFPLDLLPSSTGDTELLLQPWGSSGKGTAKSSEDSEPMLALSGRGSQADPVVEFGGKLRSHPQTDASVDADLLMKVFSSVSGCGWLDDVLDSEKEQSELVKHEDHV
jgi:hypothetical protein